MVCSKDDRRTKLVVHLNSLSGIGPVTINTIVDSWPVGFASDDFYTLLPSDKASLFGISVTCATKITELLRATEYDHNKEWDILKESVVYGIITRCDADYPYLLKNIYAPPPVLYYAGSFAHYKRCTTFVACVGSRNATVFGERMVSYLVPPLVRAGSGVISGGARGIDTLCHRTALQEGGCTVVVLGSGLLCPYPGENKKLFDDIITQSGIIISPFSLMTPARTGNFPARNRIIAGMSHGCLVIQAAASSGALITASYALEQGKEIFAVPGPCDDPLSAGCNGLIAQGATIVMSPDTVTDGLGVSPRIPVLADQKVVLSDITVSPEQRILSLCMQRGALSLDEMMIHLNEPLFSVQQAVSLLNCEGKIEQDFSGLWKVV